MGLKSVAADLGVSLAVKIMTDASAAKAAVSRTGLGKLRHVEVKYLWLQDLVTKGKIQVAKVARQNNPADALTKYQGAAEMRKVLEKVGVLVVASGGSDKKLERVIGCLEKWRK